MLAIALTATLSIAFTDAAAVAAGPLTKAPSAPTAPTSQGKLPWLQQTKSSSLRSISPLASAPSVGGSWSWRNPLPDGNPLYAISCPTASTCFAAGFDSPILSTTNGGSTWSQQTQGFG